MASLPDLAVENALLRKQLAAAERPNRQRILVGLLIAVVIAAFGLTIVLLQTQVISNQTSARARGVQILKYNRQVLGDLNHHSGQISGLQDQIVILQREVQAARNAG